MAQRGAPAAARQLAPKRYGVSFRIHSNAGQPTSSRDGVSKTRTLLLAVALDTALGESPPALHPVVWMGRMLTWLERNAPAHPAARLAYGSGVAIGLPMAWALVAAASERLAPWWLQAALLKPTFAGRALLDAASSVERRLEADDLAAARMQLRALVSRPTATLSPEHASAAAIESLAENFTDSWLAPLLAYCVGGLPLAYAYRMANTADAMWGYRTERYEYLGKAAARLDDALNWLPSRCAAVCICMLGGIDAWRAWREDRGRTASPNAGQTMTAMAGALGVRLEKSGHYELYARGRAPTAADIGRARRVIMRAMLLSTALIAIASQRWRN